VGVIPADSRIESAGIPARGGVSLCKEAENARIRRFGLKKNHRSGKNRRRKALVNILKNNDNLAFPEKIAFFSKKPLASRRRYP